MYTNNMYQSHLANILGSAEMKYFKIRQVPKPKQIKKTGIDKTKLILNILYSARRVYIIVIDILLHIGVNINYKNIVLQMFYILFLFMNIY